VQHLADGRLKIVEPFEVPRLGAAVMEIEDGATASPLNDWRMQAGIGGMALGGVAGLIAFGIGVNQRVRGMRVIRESLAAMGAGEADPRVLAVAPSLGVEAEAWNRFLSERADMLAHQARASVEQKLGDRRGRDSDLFGLCDAMWQGLMLVDDKLRVKYVNGAAANFLRAKREEMVGRDVSQYVTDQKVLEALKSLAAGTGRGRTVVEVDGDKESIGGAGSVFRYSLRPVRKEDAASAVVVIEDITQQRVAEEARHSFVASATHELRTPLTNMRLYIDSLLEEPDQDVQKRTQAMNVVSQEARRLERMVGDMLSVAQIESGSIKLQQGDVRLEPVFEELRADFAEQARQKEIKLRFDMPPKWPQMKGDRDKIVMALHNLVGNAIKYTPAGGEVIVRAAPSSDEKMFVVDVVDNGIGIKDEEQTLVFEKFYRAQDKRIAGVTGTGLGLAIAREVVRLHGGDISLKSAIDKGSTFTMTLPAKAA
jgi:PAS domain S-box-containing protein